MLNSPGKGEIAYNVHRKSLKLDVDPGSTHASILPFGPQLSHQ